VENRHFLRNKHKESSKESHTGMIHTLLTDRG
jgi:hypothetical protein